MADIAGYLARVTSQHRDKPNFIATLSALLQPMAGAKELLAAIPDAFDVEAAIGVQEDIIGRWVGRTRFLDRQPIAGTFTLADPDYRILLRAVIAANSWDGSIPGAYAVWAIAFPPPLQAVVQDNGDLSMTLGLAGPPPSAVTQALLTGGYLNLKPAGIRIKEYAVGTGPGPLFGFGADGSGMAGFGLGSWAKILPPT